MRSYRVRVILTRRQHRLVGGKSLQNGWDQHIFSLGVTRKVRGETVGAEWGHFQGAFSRSRERNQTLSFAYSRKRNEFLSF